MLLKRIIPMAAILGLIGGTTAPAQAPKNATSKPARPFYTTSEFEGTEWIIAAENNYLGGMRGFSVGGRYIETHSIIDNWEGGDGKVDKSTKYGNWKLRGNELTMTADESPDFSYKFRIRRKDYMTPITEDGSGREARLKR